MMDRTDMASRLRRGDFVSVMEHCHLPGLTSIVLEPRRNETDGMQRIFWSRDGCRMDRLRRGGDFSLLPHNHRQTIQLKALCGGAVNVDFEVGEHGFLATEYEFTSALLTGEFGFRPVRPCRLAIRSVREIGDAGIILPWSEVHTVMARPESAWLVTEGQVAPAGSSSLCYSLKGEGLRLERDGLYEVLGHSAALEHALLLAEFIERAATRARV